MSRVNRTGILTRHKRSCASLQEGVRCNCAPTYRAEAYDRTTGRRKYRTFPTAAAAQNWRRDMQIAIASGRVRAVKDRTVAEAWSEFVGQAENGIVRTRSGTPYKPSVLHSYCQLMELHVLRCLGRAKVGDVRRAHVQQMVDELVAGGSAAQTVRNVVTVTRVLFKWAMRADLIAVNPCDGVALPAGGKVRDRIVPPPEAVELVNALERPQDRALYATAFFAGLRLGELLALDWDAVDLVERRIAVRRAWDSKTKQTVAPKSKAGARTLGFPQLLVPYLAALDETSGYVFRGLRGGMMNYDMLRRRAAAQWTAAGMQPIGLHEARHTYASLMIAAGVSIKTIQTWMGHASITITLDRYGHLLPGSEAEAIGLFDAYLEREIAGAS